MWNVSKKRLDEIDRIAKQEPRICTKDWKLDEKTIYYTGTQKKFRELILKYFPKTKFD